MESENNESFSDGKSGKNTSDYRKERNKQLAKQSRKWKKEYIESLEKSVEELQQENKRLKD